MAKLFVVAVYDSAAETYMQPWFVTAKGLAIRSFMDEVNRAAEGNPLYAHPDDFRLVYLGEYDNVSGVFHSLMIVRR